VAGFNGTSYGTKHIGKMLVYTSPHISVHIQHFFAQFEKFFLWKLGLVGFGWIGYMISIYVQAFGNAILPLQFY